VDRHRGGQQIVNVPVALALQKLYDLIHPRRAIRVRLQRQRRFQVSHRAFWQGQRLLPRALCQGDVLPLARVQEQRGEAGMRDLEKV